MASESSGRGGASQSAAASGKQRDADSAATPVIRAVTMLSDRHTTMCHMTKSQPNQPGRLK
jgi:hypothetical protein